MENIIAQQLVKMQEKILGKIQEDGLENIGQTAEALYETLKEGTCELLQAILEATDAEIGYKRAEAGRIEDQGAKRGQAADNVARGD